MYLNLDSPVRGHGKPKRKTVMYKSPRDYKSQKNQKNLLKAEWPRVLNIPFISILIITEKSLTKKRSLVVAM